MLGKTICASMLLALPVARTGTAGGLDENLLSNGGFEAGNNAWWHPKDRYGGQIDPQLRRHGLNSWRMDLKRFGKETIISSGGAVKPGRDHQVSVWIRCRNVAPADAVTVRVLQFALGKPNGWYTRDGNADLIHTGGSHDWYRFRINVPKAELRPDTDRLTVFLRAAPGSNGTVWFDEATLRPTTGEPPGELLDAQAAPPLRRVSTSLADEAAAFRDIPFLNEVGEGIKISCGSDHNLFYGPSPVRVTLHVTAPAPARLAWVVSDYWGRIVRRGNTTGTRRISLAGMGYFEVAARLSRNGKQIGAARISLAHLPKHPHAETAPKYLLGSWVQQNDLLDDIGARWTRVGTGWRYLEPKPGHPNEELWQRLDAHIAGIADSGIAPIFLFAKVPKWAGPHHKRVAPQHWGDFRRFVRKCVSRYRKYVNVWEVMNEPYIPTLFPGTLDEIMQWHRIVREEVDRGDPGGLVIGPCLNTRNDYLFKEMRQLLEMGIGRLVDGISIHTYGGLEAAGFLEHFAKLRKLLDEFGANKPLYITEQGLSVPEKLPLERIQARYFARMLLLCMQARVKVVIWHMMSWPQGASSEQRNFAVVRARKDLKQRAPRPAFVAAATLSSVLGNARFRRSVPGLGKTAVAQVYQTADGESVIALWDWGQPERRVQLDVGVPRVTVVDIVGARRTVQTTDGRLELSISPDPVYILGAKSATPVGEPRL
ncbi:MAG: hypothetical protein GXP31_06410 [Kiritimatiellaeota bacterium]|nr:hypothetical protein [Kiritimatiellota bacterium]